LLRGGWQKSNTRPKTQPGENLKEKISMMWSNSAFPSWNRQLHSGTRCGRLIATFPLLHDQLSKDIFCLGTMLIMTQYRTQNVLCS
jgi:hypothetical protein